MGSTSQPPHSNDDLGQFAFQTEFSAQTKQNDFDFDFGTQGQPNRGNKGNEVQTVDLLGFDEMS
jgi:hypothetical protein